MNNGSRIRLRILGLSLVLYSMCLIYWMFFGFGRTRHTEGPLVYNLVPLETIWSYMDSVRHGFKTSWIINLFGNVGVFVPFGFVLPLLFKSLRSYWRLTLYFVPLVIVLEVSQMLLRVGSCDIDDLILNILGVCIGYGVTQLLFRRYIS